MNLLEVKNISKTYGSGETAVKALKNVSFSVPKGEYVAIVGESGSGKSTLLNMIGALDTPTSGKVLIDGKDIFSMNDRKLTVFRRRNIGFIFQAFNLIPELTVEQNIIFPVLLDYQKPDKKYLEEQHPVRYNQLLLSGELSGYLAKLDKQAEEQLALTIRQMQDAEGVTEALKVENQLEWVRRMNSIRSRAEEIIKTELIFV